MSRDPNGHLFAVAKLEVVRVGGVCVCSGLCWDMFAGGGGRLLSLQRLHLHL